MKKYKILYQNSGKIEKIYIETSNILNEDLPKNIVDIKEIKNSFRIDFFQKRYIKEKELNLLFYELNLMLESNINLLDALDILIKNKKDDNLIKFLKLMKYSFSNGKPIIENLHEYKVDNLVVAFLKISQENGNINLMIKSLHRLLKENYEIKKSFIKSISYPIVLLISFFISLITIFNVVIPKFKIIFSQLKNDLPIATKILLYVDFIFENYILYILIFLLFLFFMFIYIYKQNSKFSYFIEKILVQKVFLISDIYKNMQLYKTFLMMDIMLKSDYEFHKALNSSKILLKNKYLLDKISIIDNLLQNGKSISAAFLKTELFDDMILNLINTAELSNRMEKVVEEIKEIYKNRFYEKINLLIIWIQPTFLIVIVGCVGDFYTYLGYGKFK